MYDAVNIEYACAYLLEKEIGGRGGIHDADVFRGGDYKDLGKLLETLAKHFKIRAARIQFAPEESKGGGAEARLRMSIDGLATMGAQLKERDGEEREDFHWEIIGYLVGSLAALLDHFEGKGAPD